MHRRLFNLAAYAAMFYTYILRLEPPKRLVEYIYKHEKEFLERVEKRK